MTKFQREKQALLDAGREIDKKADEIVGEGETFLAKIKKSSWTAGILAAGATFAVLAAAFYISK